MNSSEETKRANVVVRDHFLQLNDKKPNTNLVVLIVVYVPTHTTPNYDLQFSPLLSRIFILVVSISFLGYLSVLALKTDFCYLIFVLY